MGGSLAPFRKINGQDATVFDPHRRADGEVCGPHRVGDVVRRDRGPFLDGIACPACGDAMGRVVDSRPAPRSVRRRRECATCGVRVTTYERAEAPAAPASAREYVLRVDGERVTLAPKS